MGIMTLNGGAVLTYTSETWATAPATAYSAWCSAIGVSDVTTLVAIDSDDTSFPFALQAPFFPMGSSDVFYASEASIGFALAAPSSTVSTQYPTFPERFYGPQALPAFVVMYHPGGDLKSQNGKVQKSGSTTLIYAEHSQYDNDAVNRYDCAIRITPQSIEIVGTTTDADATVRLIECFENNAPNDADTIRQQLSIQLQALGTTYRYTITEGAGSGEGTAGAGFSTTSFGTPLALQSNFARSFSATSFGTTSFGIPLAQSFFATSFGATSFGTPAAIQRNSAQGISLASFGTPTSPQLVQATAEAWLATRFGRPSAIHGAANVDVPLSFACPAFGFTTSTLGKPASAYLQIGAAAGAAFGATGTPTGMTQQVQASGFVSGATGTESHAGIRLRHTGARLTEVGTPEATRILLGTASAPSTRFGTARTAQGGEHLATGVGATRFGTVRAMRVGDHSAASLQPRGNFGRATGFSRFNYPATEFGGASVGTPTCHERRRVAHIAPATAFGVPLLRRASTC